MTTTPWLTDAEIDDLCTGLVNNAAKIRHLRRLGLTVNQKPNGRPLVIRTHAEAVLAGLQQLQQAPTPPAKHVPNLAAYRESFCKKPQAA